MRTSIVAATTLSILMFSCHENANPEKQSTSEKAEILEPEVIFTELESDFMTWWTYHSQYISLSSNFTGLSEQSEKIDRRHFLEKLTTGDYIPLELKTNDGLETYKLFKLDSNSDKSIGSTIKNESKTQLKHLKMEGLPFPEFELSDLKGNTYTNENTLGKTVVLKTWFINCAACIAEFPELNAFVDENKNNDDLIFLSLALNTSAELENFLKKKEFKYQVIADQRDLIAKRLNLQSYPTHIVVDENGTILKVVNKASELISFLKNEKKLIKEMPPPPSAF